MEKAAKKRTRTNKLNYIAVFLILVLIILAVLSFLSRPLKTDRLNVRFIVSKNIGVDLNSSELNYGMIPPGTLGSRKVIIDNNHGFPIKVNILVSDGLKGLLLSDSLSYTIAEGETRKIPIFLDLPDDIPYGNYSGEIKLKYFRKWFL